MTKTLRRTRALESDRFHGYIEGSQRIPAPRTSRRSSLASLIQSIVLASTAVLAPAAFAQPTLVVNSIPTPPQTDNTAVPHLLRGGPLSLQLKGTPNAPFALLLAADAFDGSPIGETNIPSGFFLKPWVLPGTLDVPIHPVLDGIGMEFIRQKLNSSGQATLAADDIVNDTPSPLIRFNAAGEFNLAGLVPLMAVFVNLTPSVGAPNPLPIPLESSGSTTIALYMQVVELNTSTLAVTTGTGCKVIFDPITFSAQIAYAEGTSSSLPSTSGASVVTQTVFPALINDPDLADASSVAPVVASDFSFATQGIDFWVIGLAGYQGLYESSNPANGLNGAAATTDQDVISALAGSTTGLTGLWNQMSHTDFRVGNVNARNNENKDFPRIDLPGNRSLFHYRDVATGRYGFGILFRDTNTWRNLTPFPDFAFTNTTVLSAWEYEVAISPDGNRAVVVLDQPSPATTDRVFMLNLEPGGSFANGGTLHEFVATPDIISGFSRVYDESMAIVSDGAGSWVAFFAGTTTVNPTTATYPNRLFRVNLANSPGVPTLVLPGGAFPATNRVDRQFMVSPDLESVMVIGGTGVNAEHVHVISNVTTLGHSIVNASGNLLVALQLGEFNESNNGQLGAFAVSDDSTRLAFCVEDGSNRWPRIAALDGSTAGSTVNLIKDITDGGVIDKADFGQSRDYAFSQDGNHLIYQQGFFVAGALSDRFELFTTNVNSTVTMNLSRTCKTGATAAPATLFGPWDPAGDLTSNRASWEPCGNFKSPNGDYLYLVREMRGVPATGFDRQNVIAVSIATPPNASDPTFEMVNITGTEFEPFDGQPPPPFGAPDVSAGGSIFGDTFPEYHRFRRVGGTGPYKDYMYFVAQLANLPLGDPKINVDQLFVFDSVNPGPAIQLTHFFNGTGSQYALRTNARIVEVNPSQVESKVLFIVDNGDISGGTDNAQDLFLADFAAFGALSRVPSTATPYSRIVVRGSHRFFPGTFGGVLFSAGLNQRPLGALLDGFAMPSPDPANAVDSTAFFYRTIAGTSLTAIVPLTTNSRAATIFNVLPN